MHDEVLILDGGLSTALAARGTVVGGVLWTGELLLSSPDLVVQAHKDFVDAGADIIITGSYQLSFEGGGRLGWSADEVTTALRNSTTAARMAAAEGTLVAASVGPYGAMLADGSEFRGNPGVSAATFREFHARRLDILLETEPDLLAIETQPELAEVDVILDVIAERSPDIPLWVSCTVTQPGRMAGGAPFSELVARVEDAASAIAVGINCSTVEVIAPTLAGVETELPFVVYPNLGQEWDSATDSWRGHRHDTSAADIAEWVALGARIIGGCCGYAASDILALRRQV